MNETTFQRHLTVSRPVRRLALILAAGALFLGIASVIKPAPRSASATPTDPALMEDFAIELKDVFVNPVDPNSTDPREADLVRRLRDRRAAQTATTPDHHLIGIVESRSHALYCYATPQGARYSVYTLDGRLLQSDLPADEVYRAFPDIDLENMRVDPPQGTPLMSAESLRD